MEKPEKAQQKKKKKKCGVVLDILYVYNVYVTEGKLEIKRAYISE